MRHSSSEWLSRTLLTLTALLGASILASAQGFGRDLTSMIASLSQKCQARMAPIISSNFATCIDMTDLAAIMAVSSTQSILPQVGNWIEGIDKEQPCQTSDLASVKQALDSSCSSGSDAQNPTVLALNELVVNYSQLRELLILKQTSTSPASSAISSTWATTSTSSSPAAATSSSQYCVFNILNEAQQDTRRVFSKDNLSNFLAGSSTQMIELLQSVNKETYCNVCGQGIVSKTVALLDHQNTTSSAQQRDDLKKNFVGKCGDQYSSSLDGTVPAGLEIPESGALPLMGSALSMLLLAGWLSICGSFC